MSRDESASSASTTFPRSEPLILPTAVIGA